MKKFWILVAASLAACQSAPGFFVGEKVRVKEGYYWNCRGRITDYDSVFHKYRLSDVTCPRFDSTVEFNFIWVDEGLLEEIK